MSKRKRPALPSEFRSWEECRDYYALESIFLGQGLSRSDSGLRQRRYMAAAQLAVDANARCKHPLPDEEAPGA